ncbi:DUF3885 domain-containing protein [Streptomyces cavernicola]|uniref:DUF3885 domain-containing protein n=1 Tax=Streptomyces cavernicola TaxID=3043613 RepID=A0ABT6SIP4_9ACTN|nr:hypothetical protein [Streptomyces sp. B-S-A6]MDI3408043.1 hypothetical protein [Streptomyces sp. B-S-A6]
MTSAEDPYPVPARLAALWRARRPSGPPVAHAFRGSYADRWVRFHSLPGSKRYPESPGEYATVLARYNTVLDELFAGQDVFVVTTDWSTSPTGPAAHPTRRALHPGAALWWTEADDDDPDSGFHTYVHMYADVRRWERGCADGLLRAVAGDELAGVFLTDSGLRRIHHPYDGGADVVLATPEERDRLRERHRAWLPHLSPSGS